MLLQNETENLFLGYLIFVYKITKLKDWRTYIISGRLVCKIKLADMSMVKCEHHKTSSGVV